MPHVPGHNGNRSGENQTNLVTLPNQFINRRTGQPVPAGMPYHIHPDKGPMAGAVHNPNIEGGTQGHDFYDAVATTRASGTNNRFRAGNTRSGMTTSRRAVSSGTRSSGARSSGMRSSGMSGYRRGGNIRRFGHGGSHSRNNGCGPGMMFQDGGCVPASSGGYRTGGSTRKMFRGGVYSMNSDQARKMRKR